MVEDVTLLQGFVQEHREGDFGELVRRHVGMVFATALRRVGGDAHLAEDVTQSVFIDLARKAPALLHHRVLGAWLHTSAVYAAAKTVRSEQRRRRREEHAHAMQEPSHETSADAKWARVRPVLDDALQALPTRDREAILLRFFSVQGFADIGRALHVSESAARMRVDRALDRLRTQLARRGIGSTVAALGTVLSTHAAVAPPAALAGAITTTALAGASGAGVTVACLNLLAMTKIQLGLAAAVVVLGVSTHTLEYRKQNELRAELAIAASRADESAQLRAEITHLRQADADVQALKLEAAELARLRREIADLQERRARMDAQSAAQVHRPSPSIGAPSPISLSRTAGFDLMPRPLHKVSVQYPETLRRASIPGEVLISFIVDAEGRVQDPQVIESTHPDFVGPALESIVQWQFAAGRKGDRPVHTRVQMPVVFAVEHPNWF